MLTGSLDLQAIARPVRIAYLVRSSEDLLSATRLFTHLWGGQFNSIFPSPTSTEESSQFNRALRRFNPDLVVFSDSTLNSFEQEVLEEYPAELLTISNDMVEKHSDGIELLRVLGGRLPHIGTLMNGLYPNNITNSKLRLVEHVESDLCLSLIYGCPSDQYQKYLKQHLSAVEYKFPNNTVDFIKVAILGTEQLNPLSATTIKVNRNYQWDLFGNFSHPSLEDMSLQSNQVLLVFLHSNNDLHTIASFWNSRACTSPSNKVLLPKAMFEAELTVCLNTLCDVSKTTELVFIAKMSKEEANNLYEAVQENLPANMNATISIFFDGYDYSLTRSAMRYGLARSSYATADSDSKVRFPVESPVSHDRSDYVFGFDCQIRSGSGVVLGLPAIRPIARVLANEQERLTRARRNENGLGNSWLRQIRVRPSKDGISGIIKPGQEVQVFLHPDNVWIEEFFLSMDISIKHNSHTRYAAGFVRRFGGIDQGLSLIQGGGQYILSALVCHRAAQCGFVTSQVISFLKERLNFTQDQAARIVAERLPQLLRAGIVRRGFGLMCPHCSLKAWYPVEELTEMIECRGCAEKFQLEGKSLEFRFVINELGRRFVESGGEAILRTTAVVRSIESSVVFQFGGDLCHPNDMTAFAEVDLVFLTTSGPIIAECKAYDTVNEEKLLEFRKSGQKIIEVAHKIGIPEVLFGVTTRGEETHILNAASELAEQGETYGITADLILNDKMYLRGKNLVEIRSVRFDSVVNRQPISYIGRLFTSIGLGLTGSPFLSHVVEQWDKAHSSYSTNSTIENGI